MSKLLNFKSFFKFLSKNKAYTAIDIFGLSISLMFVILIAVYTVQELSTDRFQRKADRIYVQGNENWLGSAYRLAARLTSRYPEIEKICPVVSNFGNQSVYVGDNRLKADLLFADTTFFDLFTFPLQQGDPQTVMTAKNYAVVSESFARKAFQDRDPLGQYVQVNDSVTVMVNGIMKDIKNSTIPYADILIRIDNIRFFNSSLDSESFDNALGADLFILEREGADLLAKTEDMEEYFREIYWLYKRGITEKVTLVPLKEVYFSGKQSYNGLRFGDRMFVIILMSVGILILLFAIINYINLTVAQTGTRAKEMATRRLLGSSRSELFLRLILESTLLSFISFVLGILLALAVAPVANNLLQTKIDLADAVTPYGLLAALLLIGLLGVVSGLLPAIIISNSKPIDIVKGGFRTKTKMVFSKLFITFQNVITIIMLVASIVMVLQITHMIKAPLGYNTHHLMRIPSYQFGGKDRLMSFGNEVAQLASVSHVAYSQGTPFDKGNNHTTFYEEKNISFQLLTGDSVFFNLMGFTVLRENQVASGKGFYLTEQALLETGLPEDAQTFHFWGHDQPVAGILKDFQLRNINEAKSPTLVRVLRVEDFYPWNLVVEVQGDPYAAYDQIKEIYQRMTEMEFTGEFIDKQIQDSFESQIRISKIVMIFCGIAIVISLLGLLAMSTYFIQQRSREIAVRKVFGSSEREVWARLVSTFLSYVLIAFVIATPVVWYIMTRWISGFSYRISLAPWIFIAAGLFCLFVSFVVVFWQSYKAAGANPVESIKVE